MAGFSYQYSMKEIDEERQTSFRDLETAVRI